ncbi:aldo/keto reductase [Clavibacter sp. VKM Ac-2872]|uniref:aldo/keto reductase n=1 Tax=Clavibacter sp. VKM Ac-2872 TaxID=2783812 RepID=UPI00188C9183|nr:aldo/keto reductase [Clavibacter sp. VKM Ac-2872]MBF4624886.1 aldo/keto reductase [Clavibacter sp. VKM Ac-2872]
MFPAAPGPRTRALGTSGVVVSTLGLGTSGFGWTTDREEAFAILDAYREEGGTFVDTASSYSQWVPGHAGGESEAIIGGWLAARGCRDEVVVGTKVGKSRDAPGTSAASIRRGVDASLRRLGTGHVDVVHAHLDDTRTPLEETVAALSDLVKEGKARLVGVSGFRPERIEEALALAHGSGAVPVGVVQEEYSLLARDHAEGRLQALVRQEGLGLVAHSVLAKGFLTGKYLPGAPAVPSARALDAEQYMTAGGHATVRAAEEIARMRGVTVAEVAIAWVLGRPGIASALVGARTARQIRQLMPAAQLVLDDDEVSRLASAAARATRDESA